MAPTHTCAAPRAGGETEESGAEAPAGLHDEGLEGREGPSSGPGTNMGTRLLVPSAQGRGFHSVMVSRCPLPSRRPERAPWGRAFWSGPFGPHLENQCLQVSELKKPG